MRQARGVDVVIEEALRSMDGRRAGASKADDSKDDWGRSRFAAVGAAMQASSRVYDQELDRMRQKAIPVDSDGEWQLYLVDTLQWGEFYVDSEHASTYISPATWETLSYSEEATAEFLDAYQEGAGMKRLVTDAGRFREAALAEVRSNGTDVPAAKDVLTCLAEEANALIVQAAALNLQPTPLQIESFAMRLTELRERFTEVETQVEGLRSLLDLAELSVLDAANG